MSDKTKESVICNACNKELIVNTVAPANFYLELRVQNGNRNETGPISASFVNPPLEESKHFCGLNCLNKWAQAQVVLDRSISNV